MGKAGETPDMDELHPEIALAISYAPVAARPGLAALFALDAALAQLLRTTREAAIGQIRMAWWRERLVALDSAPPPAHPVLAALAEQLLLRGVSGASLVPIVDGWEVLMEEEIDASALERFATGRGATLFTCAATLTGGHAPFVAAGEGWALVDLALHLRDAEGASAARALAQTRLAPALAARWPREARALGVLAHLAQRDLATAPGANPPVGAPGRIVRMLWHRLSGR